MTDVLCVLNSCNTLSRGWMSLPAGGCCFGTSATARYNVTVVFVVLDRPFNLYLRAFWRYTIYVQQSSATTLRRLYFWEGGAMLMQNMSSIRLDEDDEIKSTHQTARVNRINIKQPHIAPRVPPAEGTLGRLGMPISERERGSGCRSRLAFCTIIIYSDRKA